MDSSPDFGSREILTRREMRGTLQRTILVQFCVLNISKFLHISFIRVDIFFRISELLLIFSIELSGLQLVNLLTDCGFASFTKRVQHVSTFRSLNLLQLHPIPPPPLPFIRSIHIHIELKFAQNDAPHSGEAAKGNPPARGWAIAAVSESPNRHPSNAKCECECIVDKRLRDAAPSISTHFFATAIAGSCLHSSGAGSPIEETQRHAKREFAMRMLVGIDVGAVVNTNANANVTV